MGNPYDVPSQGSPFGPSGGPSSNQGFPSPLPSFDSRQALLDSEHLRLLRIGYFISAGQAAFFIPFGLMYAGMGVMIARFPTGSAPPPAMMSWIFGVFGGVFAVVAALVAVLKLFTAIRLKERRSRTLCQITAGLSCLGIPYGTALGVMTFMVLSRPSVRQLFDERG